MAFGASAKLIQCKQMYFSMYLHKKLYLHVDMLLPKPGWEFSTNHDLTANGTMKQYDRRHDKKIVCKLKRGKIRCANGQKGNKVGQEKLDPRCNKSIQIPGVVHPNYLQRTLPGSYLFKYIKYKNMSTNRTHSTKSL